MLVTWVVTNIFGLQHPSPTSMYPTPVTDIFKKHVSVGNELTQFHNHAADIKGRHPYVQGKFQIFRHNNLWLAWNLKNHKNSIIRLLVVRIQFWKKVVVELFCFRPNIYLSISNFRIRSSKDKVSKFNDKKRISISRASYPRNR